MKIIKSDTIRKFESILVGEPFLFLGDLHVKCFQSVDGLNAVNLGTSRLARLLASDKVIECKAHVILE